MCTANYVQNKLHFDTNIFQLKINNYNKNFGKIYLWVSRDQLRIYLGSFGDTVFTFSFGIL